MSNPAPQQAPQRTGLHPLAWVGIGCGVILVLVLIAVMVGGFFLARTVKDVAGDFEDNPGLAAARLVVKASPDLEEVEVDKDAGTMTVRNTKTGELVTLNFEDIRNGRFSWTDDDGQEVSVDVSDADSGTVKVESSDGDGFTLSTGAAVSEEIPEWVPIFPGSETRNRGTMTTSDSLNGNFTLTTDADVDEVLAFYRDTLESAGYKVSVNSYTSDDAKGAMLNGTDEAEERTVIVILGTDGGATQATVTYTSKK